MGRHQNGFALAFQPQNYIAQVVCADRVEAGGGLVEHEKLGVVDYRLREPRALRHSLGVEREPPVRGVVEPPRVKRPHRRGFRFGGLHSAELGVEHREFESSQKPVKIGRLRKIPHLRPRRPR